MKIETKFNAGDKVWIVVFDSVYLKFVPEYRIIDQIKIKISNGGEKFSMLLARIDESKNKIANLTGELSRMNAEWETRRETLHNLIEELKKS